MPKSFGPALPSANLAKLTVLFGVLLMVFRKLPIPMQLLVGRLAREHNDVLFPIVGFGAVDVVYPLIRKQESPKHLLGNEAMLVDIALTVGKWMIGGIDVNVSASMHKSAAVPFVAFGPAFGAVLMTTEIRQMLAFVVTALRMVHGGYRRFLSAAAKAQAGFVSNDGLPSGCKHEFGRFRSSPVAPDKLLARGRRETTTAGATSIVCHRLILSHDLRIVK